MNGGTRANIQGSVGSLGQHPADVSKTLVNWNTNDACSNHNEEEHNNNERPKTEKSKESFSIDVEVIKGIQAQIASLT